MPCPISTTVLDQHRDEVEQAGAAVGKARNEERALRARRDDAARRAAAAEGALDSLRTPGASR